MHGNEIDFEVPAGHAGVILFKPGGKYYTGEPWPIPSEEEILAKGGSRGDRFYPGVMAYSAGFRRIDGGPVYVPTQEPWGHPALIPPKPLTVFQLGEVIWNISRADEGTISATGATIIARQISTMLQGLEVADLAEHAGVIERIAHFAHRILEGSAETAGGSMDLDYAHDELTKAAQEYLR